MRKLSVVELRELRARAHGILDPLPVEAAGVVSRAVALQGQSLPDVLRAIALRAGTDVAAVRRALDTGALVRGWPMRGTLFAVTPRDLAGLLSLTADRVLRSTARRREQLGIDEAVLSDASAIAAAALDGPGLTRAELLAAWADEGVRTDGQRGYHLICHLSLRGLLHWGPTTDAESGRVEQRLVRTTEVVHEEDRDQEALLGRIVRGYLEARGPATVDDIAWWLKLPKRDVRRGLESIVGDTICVDVEGQGEMLVLARTLEAFDGAERRFGRCREVRALPGFDEWTLGYRDRGPVASERMQAAMTPGGNGVFRPVVVVDGEVVGTWLPAKGRRSEPSLELVERVPARVRARIERALAAERPA